LSASDEKLREYLKRVTADLRKTRRRLRDLEAQAGEPIAIVGMSCRYPGDVRSPESLWSLVVDGRDAIGAFPTDRDWHLDDIDQPGLESTMSSRGGFVYDAGDFDAPFFGISPREALAMDPQQRILLEASWELFDHAGLDPYDLRGSRTGVFTGISSFNYGQLSGSGAEVTGGYRLTGEACSVASGRVAYTFGLEGPAISLDTACSSSLVALHLACQALRAGECSLAVAGGVTVMADPMMFVEFARQRGLASDGRCKSFAAEADGTGWSEGVGLLALERLSDAQRLGHEVLALVRGSAINQDGSSNGLTAPSGPAQEQVIGDALASAGLAPRDVDAVEAHGTGTRLGDPIEAQALLAAYGRERRQGHHLWLGSIKSNIGHAQAAAGVAGVIKMAMALKHGLLPRTLHAENPSPEVDWSSGTLALLGEELPWVPSPDAPRRVGVSSFGISGTNAHVILEEAPTADVAQGKRGVRSERYASMLPFVVSARSSWSLRKQADRLADWLAADSSLKLADVAYSLTRRSALECRAAVIGGSREELLDGLDAIAQARRASCAIQFPAAEGVSHGGLAFLFTGQGAQRVGMGRELYEAFPVFREAFEQACEQFDEHLDGALRDVVFAGADMQGELDRTAFTQAGLFALELALFRLLESFGVTPDYLIGHSVGEIVAVHVAGVLTLGDACKLVAARGMLMGDLPAGGAMVAIQASESEALQALAEQGGHGPNEQEPRVALAAVNAPNSIVLSGDEDAVLRAEGLWQERGRKTTRLRVSHAFHSPRIDEMLERFAAVAQGLSYGEPRIPVVSNLSGRVDPDALRSAEYWVRHARETVRFADGIAWLSEQGVNRFLELGPDAALSAMCRQCLEQGSGEEESLALSVSVLRRGQDENRSLRGALAQLWAGGVTVRWSSLFDETDAKRVVLPGYAFQRARYWLDGSRQSGGAGRLGQTAVNHPLLGAAVALADGRGQLLTGRVSLKSHPWLADHLVAGGALMPGAAFLELAMHAAGDVDCDTVEELTLEAPLWIPEGSEVQLQVSLGPDDGSGRRSVEIFSRSGDGLDEGMDLDEPWVRNAGGLLGCGQSADRQISVAHWPPEQALELDVEGLYESLAERGLEYGPLFRGVATAWRRGDDVFAEVSLPEGHSIDGMGFVLHPALLDASLHALAGTEASTAEAAPTVPFSWRGVRLHSPGASKLRVRLSPVATDTVALAVADEDGSPVLSVDSLVLRQLSTGSPSGANAERGAHRFGLNWLPATLRSAEIEGERGAVNEAGRGVVIEGERGAVNEAGRGVVIEAGRGAVIEAGRGAVIEAGRGAVNEAERGAVIVGGLAGAIADRLGKLGHPATVHDDLAALAESVQAGAPLPEAVIAGCVFDPEAPTSSSEIPTGTNELIDSSHTLSRRALATMQAWIADERLSSSRLAFVTRQALAVEDGEDVCGLAQAPLWGLVRAAQSEHPGRFVLIDMDDTEPSFRALAPALASGEPQLALRDGKAFVPRLTRTARSAVLGPVARSSASFDSHRTVLITGGTGALGALLARHLISVHGVRSLVLASRQGRAAQGAAQIEAELSELGASVNIEACDVSDRDQVVLLLEAIPPAAPLGAVIHLAGLLDDGVLHALTPERLDRVLAPKLDGALRLHELTEGMDLSAFVMFSSVAGTLGASGQGNYAAANAFLDALAQHRRARGLAAVSIAWGPWSEADGMTGELTTADRTRIARAGLGMLSREQGLGLFDAACACEHAVTTALVLDRRELRAQARVGRLPAVLSDLIRVPAAGALAGRGGASRLRLSGIPEPERSRVALELTLAQVAAVLGYASPDAIDPKQAFKELGLDSLAAVELRNRLSAETGLRLPATLAFDHPSAAAIVERVVEELERDSSVSSASVDTELRELERRLSSIAAQDSARAKVTARLQALLSTLNAEQARDAREDDDISAATAQEVFELIDRELGAV
jgi:acyl transferase domain-containing protein/acyl carrier protein